MSKSLATVNGNKQPSKSKANKKWQQVNKLWKQIASEEKKFTFKEQEIYDFFKFAESIIKDKELEYHKILKLSVEKLLNFLPYKSLSDYRSAILDEWIKGFCIQISNNPFNQGEQLITTDDLWKKREEMLAKRLSLYLPTTDDIDKLKHDLNLTIEQYTQIIEIMYGECPNFSKEQWFAIFADEKTIGDILTDPFFKVDENTHSERNKDGHFDFSEEDLQTFLLYQMGHGNDHDFQHEFDDFNFSDESDFFNSDHESSEKNSFHEHQTTQATNGLKNEEINKIYRQLAHKFHPDKTTDEKQKLLHSELMQKLSLAKKNKDIDIIIELAIEHLPDFSIDLSDETLDSMIHNLKEKLTKLKDSGPDYNNRPEFLVWRRFSAKTKKESEYLLKDHIQYLDERIKNLKETFIDQKMTLKKLTPILDALQYELFE